MSDQKEFDRHINAGRAMQAAGNIEAAMRHSEAARHIDPVHEDGYALHTDLLIGLDRVEDAAEATRQHLATNPTSRTALLNDIIHAYLSVSHALRDPRRGLRMRAARIRAIRSRPNDPEMVHDAFFTHDLLAGRFRRLIQRVRNARAAGYNGYMDLDDIEEAALEADGQIYVLGRKLQNRIQRGELTGELLGKQAITHFRQGRLQSAQHFAASARDLDPKMTPLYQEIKFASKAAWVPLLWPAHGSYIFARNFLPDAPWEVRIPLLSLTIIFVTIALAMAVVAIVLALPDGALDSWVERFGSIGDTAVKGLILINAIWFAYIHTQIGRWATQRAEGREVELSSDY